MKKQAGIRIPEQCVWADQHLTAVGGLPTTDADTDFSVDFDVDELKCHNVSDELVSELRVGRQKITQSNILCRVNSVLLGRDILILYCESGKVRSKFDGLIPEAIFF